MVRDWTEEPRPLKARVFDPLFIPAFDYFPSERAETALAVGGGFILKGPPGSVRPRREQLDGAAGQSSVCSWKVFGVFSTLGFSLPRSVAGIRRSGRAVGGDAGRDEALTGRVTTLRSLPSG